MNPSLPNGYLRGLPLDTSAVAKPDNLTASERRLWELCSQVDIFSAFVRKKLGKNRLVSPPVRDDLVNREFTANRPHLLWLTDITEHPPGEGKLHLCAIKDVLSKRILQHSIAD